MSERPQEPFVREREPAGEAVRPEPGPTEPPPEQVRQEPPRNEPAPAQAVREEVRPERRYPEPPPPAPPRTSPLALASTATGIAAWIFVPVIGAIAAIITGFLARDEIRRSQGRLTGNGWAIAGLVLGWVQIGGIIILAIIIAVTAGAIFL